MRKDAIAQIGLAAPRKAVDVDTPAITEKPLQRGCA
jgi:hypothetical protein